MILMERDKNILRHIEKYKSITLTQCSKIFYRNHKQAYYQARKRLSILYKNKYLKKYRKDPRSETIYFLNKHLSYHDLKVFDIYADLINMGADILFFKTKYRINNPSGYREIDALIECKYNGYFYPIILEIDMSHFTTIEKLNDIYNSKHFQDKYKKLAPDIFPTVLIFRPYLPLDPLHSDLFDILVMQFNNYSLESLFEDY
jgi:hypothetical protein